MTNQEQRHGDRGSVPPWKLLKDAAERAATPAAEILRRRSIDLLGPDAPERAELENDYARVLFTKGQMDDALTYARAASEAGDMADRLRAQATIALVTMLQEGPVVVLPPVDEAAPGIHRIISEMAARAPDGEGGDRERLATALVDYGISELVGGYPERAVLEGRNALRLSRSSRVRAVAALFEAGQALFAGDLDRAATWCAALEAGLAEEPRNPAVGLGLMTANALLATEVGDVDRALEVLDAGDRSADLQSTPIARSNHAVLRVAALVTAGRWGEAEALAARALAASEEIPNRLFVGWLWALRALVKVRTGELPTARSYLARAEAVPQSLHLGAQFVALARAEVDAAEAVRQTGSAVGGADRDPFDAELDAGHAAILGALRPVHRELASRGMETGWWPALLRQLVAECGPMGDEAMVLELLERLPVGPVTMQAVGALRAAGAALAAGDGPGIAEAADGLEAGFPYEAAILTAAAARRCAEDFETLAASRLVRRAEAAFERLGALPDRDRAARLRQWIARRAPADPAAGGDGAAGARLPPGAAES